MDTFSHKNKVTVISPNFGYQATRKPRPQTLCGSMAGQFHHNFQNTWLQCFYPESEKLLKKSHFGSISVVFAC